MRAAAVLLLAGLLVSGCVDPQALDNAAKEIGYGVMGLLMLGVPFLLWANHMEKRKRFRQEEAYERYLEEKQRTLERKRREYQKLPMDERIRRWDEDGYEYDPETGAISQK